MSGGEVLGEVQKKIACVSDKVVAGKFDLENRGVMMSS
jgi:hypothetical protein